MLRDFGTINYTAVAKILKKHDKYSSAQSFVH